MRPLDTLRVDSKSFYSPGPDVVEAILREPSRRGDPERANVVKVLCALHQLEAEAGAARGERFSASLTRLVPITGLSHPTVGAARRELERRGLVESYGEGVYALPIKRFYASIPEGDKRKSLRGRKKGKGERRGVRAIKSLAGGLTHTERILVTKEAFRILRAKYSPGKYGQLVRARLTRLLRDGFTREEALAVVTWARGKFDEGDRFSGFVDLMYLWSLTKFPGLLNAAQTPALASRGELSNIVDPDTRKAWHDDYDRRVKERGLD